MIYDCTCIYTNNYYSLDQMHVQLKCSQITFRIVTCITYCITTLYRIIITSEDWLECVRLHNTIIIASELIESSSLRVLQYITYCKTIARTTLYRYYWSLWLNGQCNTNNAIFFLSLIPHSLRPESLRSQIHDPQITLNSMACIAALLHTIKDVCVSAKGGMPCNTYIESNKTEQALP